MMIFSLKANKLLLMAFLICIAVVAVIIELGFTMGGSNYNQFILYILIWPLPILKGHPVLFVIVELIYLYLLSCFLMFVSDKLKK